MIKNKTILQISFLIKESEKDFGKQLIAVLSNKGFDSFWEEDQLIHSYINADKYKETDLRQIFNQHFASRLLDYQIQELEDKNWNEEWEKNYPPVIIANKIYIYAAFHKKENNYPYSIFIESKMSFGTAHHPTTAMMLELMLNTEFQDKSVIDAGTGTGILAIFAYLKAASNIFAYDNDNWSVENANENFQRNMKTKNRVEFGESELIANKKCDILLANIHKNIILHDIPYYALSTNLGGKVFLSGFYNKDLDEIKDRCLNYGLIFEKKLEKEEWNATIFTKKI